ncbi:1276_t:CDS:2, partial [Acaulospora morrowiae]
LSEIGPPYDLGPVSTKLFRAADDMLTSRNLDYKILYSLRFFVEQNGQFENIVEEKEIMYFGATTGKLGRATVDNVKIGFISMRHYVLPFLGGTPEEYDEM